MFGLSMTELLVVLAVALLVIGPKQLPQVAKTLGKTLRDFRRATDELRDTFEREVMDEPRPKIRPNPSAVAANAPMLTDGEDNPIARAHTANAPPKPPEGVEATAPTGAGAGSDSPPVLADPSSSQGSADAPSATESSASAQSTSPSGSNPTDSAGPAPSSASAGSTAAPDQIPAPARKDSGGAA